VSPESLGQDLLVTREIEDRSPQAAVLQAQILEPADLVVSPADGRAVAVLERQAIRGWVRKSIVLCRSLNGVDAITRIALRGHARTSSSGCRRAEPWVLAAFETPKGG
jgi:hypothetical protein